MENCNHNYKRVASSQYWTNDEVKNLWTCQCQLCHSRCGKVHLGQANCLSTQNNTSVSQLTNENPASVKPI